MRHLFSFSYTCKLNVPNCFSNFRIAEWYGTVFIGILELCFIGNAVRFFVLATYTDPGILPAVRSQKINYNRDYLVKYMSLDELSITDINPAEAFFSLRKFKWVEESG